MCGSQPESHSRPSGRLLYNENRDLYMGQKTRKKTVYRIRGFGGVWIFFAFVILLCSRWIVGGAGGGGRVTYASSKMPPQHWPSGAEQIGWMKIGVGWWQQLCLPSLPSRENFCDDFYCDGFMFVFRGEGACVGGGGGREGILLTILWRQFYLFFWFLVFGFWWFFWSEVTHFFPVYSFFFGFCLTSLFSVFLLLALFFVCVCFWQSERCVFFSYPIYIFVFLELYMATCRSRNVKALLNFLFARFFFISTILACFLCVSQNHNLLVPAIIHCWVRGSLRSLVLVWFVVVWPYRSVSFV